MRPAGPAVPLPLSAREPVLSNEKARGGDPGPRYVSLSLPVVRSCCSRSRELVSRTRSMLTQAGACFLHGKTSQVPRSHRPPRGSTAFRSLAPAAVLGQSGWRRGVGAGRRTGRMFCPLPCRATLGQAQRTSMDAARRPAPASRPPRWRRVSALLTLMLLPAACTTAGGHSGTSAATGHTPPPPSGAPLSTSPRAPGSAPGPAVSISAVGDIIMGSTPQLPPDDGRHLFDGVTGQVTGTVALANLDQTLTDDAAVSKCGAASSDCYAFRTPPAYAQGMHEAGFTIVNLANNHSHDFGDAGLRDTQAALTAHGLLYTGMPGQITVQQAGPVRLAILGFAPYAWAQSLLDIPAAQQLVRQAATQADLVLVTIHAGAEGAEEGHVRPGTEIFLGENRGDSMAFSHAVIDAGADAVLGSGPHVLRGMEWSRGRLIAYSMGNFVGYHTLSISGPLSVGGILTVTLAPDGSWRGGHLTGTQLVAPGLPRGDPSQQAVALVGELSGTDFGTCGVTFAPTGDLNPPTC